MNSSFNQAEEHSSEIDPLQRQIIDFFVDGVRVLGLPKSLGEIYGLLYITPNPLSLDDLVVSLSISKGSASQGLRLLKTLGAIRETEGHSDRRTYYEPAIDLKRLVGGFIKEQIRPHLDSGQVKLLSISQTLPAGISSEKIHFYEDRVRRLNSWMSRGRKVLPILQKILGE